MSWTYGNKIKITIFGQSHSDFIGISIDGISAGIDPQTLEIGDFLKRRSTSFAKNCSNRKEDDEPIILSGLADGKTCGAPLCVVFKNRDIKKSDYDNLIYAPRPSHADFTAYEKYSGFNDKSGGGQFSGRLTLPFCYAGGFFKSLLKSKGIIIGSKLIAVGKAKDSPFLTKITEKELIDYKIPQNMIDEVNIAAENGDSVGGIIQCCILGMPVGVGEPFFDSIESKLAALTFSIPAVKGIEFGAGFGGASMRGSEYNDLFFAENNNIKTKTNNCGGILGGLSNGMPIIFNTVIKPTPSISSPQKTIDLSTKKETEIKISGRHDACIALRALPCIESAAAIAIYMLLDETDKK